MCVFMYDVVCVCVCVQKAMRLEELNEIEMVSLRDRIQTLVAENRNFNSRAAGQREQSES